MASRRRGWLIRGGVALALAALMTTGLVLSVRSARRTFAVSPVELPLPLDAGAAVERTLSLDERVEHEVLLCFPGVVDRGRFEVYLAALERGREFAVLWEIDEDGMVLARGDSHDIGRRRQTSIGGAMFALGSFTADPESVYTLRVRIEGSPPEELDETAVVRVALHPDFLPREAVGAVVLALASLAIGLAAFGYAGYGLLRFAFDRD